MNAVTHTPESLCQLALDTVMAGDGAGGEALARPLLGHANLAPRAMFIIGLAKAASAQHRLAEAWFEQASALWPDNPDTWLNLAVARDNQGLAREANDAWLHAALAWYHRRELESARAILEKLLARDPGFAAAHVDLAAVLEELHEPAQSMRHAVMLLKALGDQVPALPAFLAALPETLQAEPAIKLSAELDDPVLRVAQTLNNLGNAALKLPDFELAERAYRVSHELAPAMPLVSFNLSMLALGRGDFEEGWALYEQRWARQDWDFPDRNLPRPAWTNEDIAGRTLLVYCEQGLGDSMQFMALVPRLVERGARVILEVQEALLWLVRNSLESPSVSVVPRMADPRQVYGDPAYDFHVSVMSLPYRLGLRFDELPVARGYLRPDAASVARWRERLPAPTGKRVGIVWAGSPGQRDDARRSIPFEQLAPLWRLPGVEWHSLQVGEAAEAALRQAELSQVHDWRGQLTPFLETAALVENLDLVITVCTSVAHLAGAMGKPVWVLLPEPSEWRWLRDRDDSPWYPSARLFRQQAPGQWAGVVERVSAALQAFAGTPA